MEKFKKYMSVLDKVLNALFIAFLVTSIVLLVLAVVSFFVPKITIGELDSVIDFDGLRIKVTDDLIAKEESVNAILSGSAIVTACQLFIACVLIKILRTLIAPMKEGNVFYPTVHQNIRKLAYYVLIGGFLTEIINSVGAYLIVTAYNINAIFNDSVVSHSFNFHIDGDFIIYAAIIYLLSYIFKYGSELQTQVDETL